MNDIPVLVCGLGRCGTTLVMKMLHHGGCEVFADSLASYEHNKVLASPGDVAPALTLVGNRAAKIIDPQRWSWPDRMDARVIWVHRDRREQAKSQIKFLRFCGMNGIPDTAWRDVERSLQPDAARALRVLMGLCPVLRITFEGILSAPSSAASHIATFLLPERNLDVAKMASVVIPRHPSCAPDCRIEMDAIAAEGCAA